MNTSKAMMDQELDVEWIDLIVTAQTMGITLEDIRHFLQESSYAQAAEREDGLI